jgi:hypothetical protein
MVNIYYGQFGLKILLLVKIYIINLLVKNYKWQFGQGILLLVKIYTINLLINICMRVIRSGNIIAGKNLHNKITDKNLHGQLFIKTYINTFIYRQCINILRGKS